VTDENQLQQEVEAWRDALVAGHDIHIHIYGTQQDSRHLKVPGGVAAGQHKPSPGDGKEPHGETGCLIIQRLHAESLQSSPFTVLIDGIKEGKVADGETAELNVSQGRHAVQVKSGGFESAEHTVDVGTSYTLTTKPDGGRGQAVTGLELHPASSARESKEPGFHFGCVLLILIVLGFIGLGLIDAGLSGLSH
jgi:hypothetical protein